MGDEVFLLQMTKSSFSKYIYKTLRLMLPTPSCLRAAPPRGMLLCYTMSMQQHWCEEPAQLCLVGFERMK